jgi:hypothetical protein
MPIAPCSARSETILHRRVERPTTQVPAMKICPIAIAVTCRRCPIVSVCPVKTIIGDYVEPKPPAPAAAAPAGTKRRRR